MCKMLVMGGVCLVWLVGEIVVMKVLVERKKEECYI